MKELVKELSEKFRKTLSFGTNESIVNLQIKVLLTDVVHELYKADKMTREEWMDCTELINNFNN